MGETKPGHGEAPETTPIFSLDKLGKASYLKEAVFLLSFLTASKSFKAFANRETVLQGDHKRNARVDVVSEQMLEEQKRASSEISRVFVLYKDGEVIEVPTSQSSGQDRVSHSKDAYVRILYRASEDTEIILDDHTHPKGDINQILTEYLIPSGYENRQGRYGGDLFKNMLLQVERIKQDPNFDYKKYLGAISGEDGHLVYVVDWESIFSQDQLNNLYEAAFNHDTSELKANGAETINLVQFYMIFQVDFYSINGSFADNIDELIDFYDRGGIAPATNPKIDQLRGSAVKILEIVKSGRFDQAINFIEIVERGELENFMRNQ